jgi:hypothetical protein
VQVKLLVLSWFAKCEYRFSVVSMDLVQFNSEFYEKDEMGIMCLHIGNNLLNNLADEKIIKDFFTS